MTDAHPRRGSHPFRACSCAGGTGDADRHAETDDEQRDDEQQTTQASAGQTRARTAAIARMLANPRRVRRG